MIADAPEIRAIERSGYPDGKAPVYPVCPVCGNECDCVYLGCAGQVVGCTDCLKITDAWEIKDCFPAE